jgi:transposase-like protein
MNCPRCRSTQTNESSHNTALGYRTFRSSDCKARFNERTGTPFNNLQFPTDIILLVVLWRLRYKLSLRDLAEMFLEHGFEFTHEAVRDWEARFAPLITAQLRAKRKGKAGKSWRCDETGVKIGGEWHYLYRAIDSDGKRIDAMLSKTRAMGAAKRFFKSAKEATGGKPDRITTDGHNSYPRAIRRILGRKVVHRTSKYLNNLIEQDQRGVKQRYYPMRGFGNFDAAARFCSAYDEQCNYFRTRSKPKEVVSLAEARQLFRQRFAELKEELIAA